MFLLLFYLILPIYSLNLFTCKSNTKKNLIVKENYFNCDEEFGEILWDHQIELLNEYDCISSIKKKKKKNKCKINKIINNNKIIIRYNLKNINNKDLSLKIKSNLENDIKNNFINDYDFLNIEEIIDTEIIFQNEKLFILILKSVSTTLDSNKDLIFDNNIDKKSYKYLKFILLTTFIFLKSPKNVI